jgi:hypothetical protein
MRLGLASSRRARPFIKSSPRSPLISAHLFTTNFITSAGISSRVSPHLFSTFPQPHPSIARTRSVSAIPPPAVSSIAPISPIVLPPFSSLLHRLQPAISSIGPVARHPSPQTACLPVRSSIGPIATHRLLNQTNCPPSISSIRVHSCSILSRADCRSARSDTRRRVPLVIDRRISRGPWVMNSIF